MTERPRQPVPAIPCCVCGLVLDTLWQAGYGLASGHWCLTCEHLDCDLWGQTFTPDHYPPADLDSYLRYGRAHRAERQRRARLKLFEDDHDRTRK